MNIIYFFLQILTFCLTDLNIYFINNKTNQFLETYIFDRKKNYLKVVIYSDPDLDSDTRIRIRIKMKRIQNTGLMDPDPGITFLYSGSRSSL